MKINPKHFQDIIKDLQRVPLDDHMGMKGGMHSPSMKGSPGKNVTIEIKSESDPDDDDDLMGHSGMGSLEGAHEDEPMEMVEDPRERRMKLMKMLHSMKS